MLKKMMIINNKKKKIKKSIFKIIKLKMFFLNLVKINKLQIKFKVLKFKLKIRKKMIIIKKQNYHFKTSKKLYSEIS
jgi:hypothetical protein